MPCLQGHGFDPWLGFPCGSAGKNLPAMWETWVQFLGWEDPLEKGMATHSSIVAWRIPWTVAHQAPLSVGFARQESWSGLPFSSPGIFPTQRSNPCLLHWQADSSVLSPQGNPETMIPSGNEHTWDLDFVF